MGPIRSTYACRSHAWITHKRATSGSGYKCACELHGVFEQTEGDCGRCAPHCGEISSGNLSAVLVGKPERTSAAPRVLAERKRLQGGVVGRRRHKDRSQADSTRARCDLDRRRQTSQLGKRWVEIDEFCKYRCALPDRRGHRRISDDERYSHAKLPVVLLAPHVVLPKLVPNVVDVCVSQIAVCQWRAVCTSHTLGV